MLEDGVDIVIEGKAKRIEKFRFRWQAPAIAVSDWVVK
jgi:hypothetical protein